VIHGLLGEEADQEQAAVPAESGSRAVLDALQDWDGLLLLDNYESVLHALEETGDGEDTPKAGGPEASQITPSQHAREIHRLVSQIAEGGTSLLLTSRQKPAVLPSEILFPGQDQSLDGIPENEAARLFLERSARAEEENAPHQRLARDVARATDGHPLAIVLLAGEFDHSEVEPADFLAGWVAELVAAELAGGESAATEGVALTRQGLILRVAFERSYELLPEALQERLRALSVFPFPFFAAGASLVWGMTAEEEDLAASGDDLERLAQAGLLEVAGAFDDSDRQASYHFHPALLPEVSHLVTDEERPKLQSGYAAYGAWLARHSYEEMHEDRKLAHLVRLSLPALEAATGELEGTERLWHVRRLTWLYNAYGETQAAYDLLSQVWPDGKPPPDPKEDREQAGIISNLHYELAQICMARGELDRAMELYEESVQLTEQIGNLEGKAASLSGLADVHMAREDWEAAEEKLVDALNLAVDLNWPEAVASNTVKLGQVAQARGDRETALERYREGLAIFEQLDMLQDAAGVEELIAGLRALGISEPSEVSHLAQLSAEARTAAQSGRFDRAIEAQEEAVALARELGDARESLIALAVQLYYLAGYYGRVEDYEGAVRALEEALGLAKRSGYEQVEAIRGALEGARQTAALSPEERADLKAAAARKQIDTIADQTRDAAIAALRGEVDPEALAAQMSNAVAGADEEEPDSPRAELAAFVWATAALLRGEPVPQVPDAYAGHLNAIRQAAEGSVREPGA
jgi:tetratricopeptide (TPR) repeat protein